MNRQHQKPIMKKKLMVFFLLLCAIVVFSAPPATLRKPAFKSETGQSFDNGSRILNVGVGFGARRYYNFNNGNGYSYRNSPAFSISYEQALQKKLGPGYLGLGGYFGFQTSSYKYDYSYYYQHRWNYYLLAARGVYHPDVLNWDKGELYGGALIGVRYQSYRFTTNSPDPGVFVNRYNDRSIWPAYSLFIGGRYYFTPAAAIFGELGWGISYLTLGISLKL
jgi:hypothetical protein